MSTFGVSLLRSQVEGAPHSGDTMSGKQNCSQRAVDPGNPLLSNHVCVSTTEATQ